MGDKRKMTDESKKNHWYEMYELECLKTKELEAQIEKMKCCGNCKNEKIEGACGHFTQVGWCKNWELAK